MQKIIEKIKQILKLKTNFATIKISIKEKINFLDQFYNLLSSGIPIINSFKIIILQTKNKKLKLLLNDILSEINKGTNLKDTVKKYKRVFSNFDISIIEMGEVTGKIGDSIEVIKIKEEKSKELKGKILGALMYPMVIVTLSIGMILVFMIYVIPKIQDMYSDAKVNLPDLTDTVIKISIFLQNNIIQVLATFVAFIISMIFLKKSKYTSYYFDRYLLKVPLFGGLIKKKILALFSFSLGTLLENGVIINEALKISSGALENKYYEKKITEMISGISRGVDLSALMGIKDINTKKESDLFPIELASVVKIGEQTGKLSHLLMKISKKFNREVDTIVGNLSVVIEPVVIILVGIIVGTLIMAIMLPFFNMVNVM